MIVQNGHAHLDVSREFIDSERLGVVACRAFNGPGDGKLLFPRPIVQLLEPSPYAMCRMPTARGVQERVEPASASPSVVVDTYIEA